MIIVITGASKGIGRAITEAFAADQKDHTFFLNARHEETLLAYANELQGRFPQSTVYAKAADLSVKEQADHFAKWVMEHTATLDILVNNAGHFLPGSVHNEGEGVLEAMISRNLYSAYWLTRKLIPLLQQTGSHIFNMCSIASVQAYANGGAYSISKFALYGFNKNLREELKPRGIKVTAVLPGAVMTDSWGDFDNSDGRIMEAADIAQLVYTAAHLSPQACIEDIVIRPVLGDL